MRNSARMQDSPAVLRKYAGAWKKNGVSETSNAVKKALLRKEEKNRDAASRRDELRKKERGTLSGQERANLLDIGFRVYTVEDTPFTDDTFSVKHHQDKAQRTLREADLLTSFLDDDEANKSISPMYGDFPKPRIWKVPRKRAEWDATVDSLPDWLAGPVREFSDKFAECQRKKKGYAEYPTWIPPHPPLSTLFPMGQTIKDDADDMSF